MEKSILWHAAPRSCCEQDYPVRVIRVRAWEDRRTVVALDWEFVEPGERCRSGDTGRVKPAIAERIFSAIAARGSLTLVEIIAACGCTEAQALRAISRLTRR